MAFQKAGRSSDTSLPTDLTPSGGLRSKLTGYGDPEFSLFLRKAFIKAMGYTEDALSKPIVGITNTYSGYNPCHRNVPDIIDSLKRGVMLAGGLPVDFPIVSLHEAFISPTTMYYRNLMAMDAEEMIRAQPMDSVILVGGCDKTVPALLMAAASANIPSIMTVTGPMMTGSHRGERIGACTDCRRLWGLYRSGELDEEEINTVSGRLAATGGTCTVMGTASTMALVAETMGMMLPGGACIPAVHSERLTHAERTGTRAVELARQPILPAEIMTADALSNAIRVVHAVGGSTNSLIHLAAIAGRLGLPFSLEEFDRVGRETPMIVDMKPSGSYYMEDLYRAGGLATILRKIRPFLNGSAPSISGKTLDEILESASPGWEQHVVRDLSNAVTKEGAIRVLRGNLAPRGAILKLSAATSSLLVHEGRAVVFDSVEDMVRRIDDPDLDIERDDVLVLKGGGPIGAPGMPEAGYIPIPRKLAAKGVKDMVRLSDARMSGTAFGTVILHITPESAVGGPFALVRTGDVIRLDAEKGCLDVLVSDDELLRRKAEWREPPPASERGYGRLYAENVNQADLGCDFSFMRRDS